MEMSFCCNVFAADQPFQLLKEQWMTGGVQPPGSRQFLFGVLQIQDHRDVAVKKFQQVDDLGIFPAAAGGL